ncbi:MAG TPA: bifunctional nuclease family protein [Gemmatimonadaceae bacterium]|nr:bifunctional nuclease family protein [Gemmatimonadaceae bacterium]
MIEVTVARLGLDSASNSYIVFLQEKDGVRFLPIWIGKPEAESILIEVNAIHRERPLTHDLCKSLIIGLGAQLRRVHITKVQKSTYYAELQLVRGDQAVHIDARPSDSIAIALRFEAPIFAEESLLTSPVDDADEEEQGFVIPGADGEIVDGGREQLSAEQLKAYLENLRPEDFGKFHP